MSTGIDPVDSAPLIIRTYNDDSADNTFLLTRYDYPVSSNYVLRTSANGELAPSDAITQTTMGMSSMTISNHFGSTMVYDTFSSGTLFLPSGVYDTIVKTTMTASSVTASTIFLNVLNICTMNASTFSPNGVTVAYTTLGSTVQTSSVTYSTLMGDSLFVTAGFVSTLFGSSIHATSAFTAAMASDTSRLSTLTMASTSVGFLSFSTLQANTLTVSTLSGSSIYTNLLTVSTLDGGSLIMSTITCLSTLSVSSLYASGLAFSTTTGSSVVMSTVTAPFLFSHSLSFSTAQGSTVTVSSATVSSLYTSLLVGSTLQTNTLVFSTLTTSSIHTSNLSYSTAQGSTMLVSTIGVSTLVVGAFAYSTLSGSSISVNTILLSTLTGSTISWNRVVLSTLQGPSAIVSSVTASTVLGNAVVAASLQGSTMVVSTAAGSSLNTSFVSASTIVSDSLFFSTLSVSTLISGSAVYSTLQGSTTTLSTLTASTLSVSTTMASTINGSSLVGSTLTASTIQSDGIVFSILHGSTLLLSTLTSCTINAQTFSVSTLQGSMVSVSTLAGSTIVSDQLTYSTLIGSTIVTDYITATSTCTGNGTLHLSTVAFSTQQTTTAFLNTLIVTSTLTVSTLNRINPTSLTASTLTLSGRLQANTATGLLTCSSLTVNAMNLSRSIVNQPVYGNTVKMESVVASGQSLVRTSSIRATIDQMPSSPQTYTFGAALPNRWIVGGNGIYPIMYSSDGIQWSGVGSDIFSTCYGIAWNGAMWVAVGITGAGAPNTMAYSYDGIRWTGIGMDIFIYGGIGISSNETMWIATGYGRNSMAYSYDGINWVGLGESVFSGSGGIAWNGTMWVAVGDGLNSIAYSYDGIIWTGLGTSIFTVGASGIAWNGTMWVAVGDGLNSIAYSYDGINWIGLGTSIFTIRGHAIAWNGTMWVAVGWGTNAIAYSYNGISWTGLGTSIFPSRGNGIAWNGTMWVAVGNDPKSIVYSYDGISWTGLETGAFFSGQTVKYNGQRPHRITFPTPMTVATGSGTNTLAYSPDGVNWTGNGLGIFSMQGNGVATNGSMWVATGSGTNTLAYSTTDIETPYIYLPFENGLYADVMRNSTVTAYGSPAFVTGPVGSKAVNLENIAGSSTASQYLDGNCTLGTNFSVSLWFKFNTLPSTDVSWSSIITLGSPTTMSFQIIYLTLAGHTGFYVQYMHSGNALASIVGRISISTGVWYQCTAVFQSAGMCSVYLNNMFVGSNPGGGLYTPITNLRIGYNLAGGVSAFDGQVDDVRIYNYAIAVNPRITWRGLGTSVFSTQGKGVAWNGSMWVAVGSGTNSIAYSYDGVTWIGLGVLVLTQGNAVAWSGTMWVAVGSGTNSIAYSYDGITWTGLGNILFSGNGVAWNGSLWVAVGSGANTIVYSYNGTTWIGLGATSPIFTSSGNGVAWNGDRWVAVGSGGNTILYSTNGLTWIPAASSCFTTAGNGVSWNGTRWVATGVGTIGIGYSSDGSTWTGGIVQDRTNTISPQLTGLAAHHWIQNGVAWKASASTEYLGVHYAYSAFTNNSSNVNTWGSALIYNATSGAYTGSVSTTVQGIGAVLGEWIQLQLSNPLILQSYTYACWGIATLPKEYYIVGSNDGSTWHPLQYVFMTINPCNATFTACSTYIQMNYTGTQTIIGNLAGSGMTTAYSSTTAAYTYFRIIVRSLWPSNTGVAEYNELYFRFGSPFTFNIFDPSRYYYHYTLYNGATITPSVIKPNTPSITLASASSQYLQTANFTPTTAGLSFAFWYKSNASGSWARIFDFGNGPASNNIFCSINGGNSNYLYFEDFYGSVPTNVTLSDISYNDNTWRHVVWTLSHAVAGSATSTWNIYINGVLKTTATAKSYPNPTVTKTISYIGRSNWSADFYYNGNIDDFRIYNSVLTASQVNTIYSGSVYDSTYNTTFSTAGSKIASNNVLSGTVSIQHPIIAVGQGTHSLAYSPDGVQWTGLGTALFTTGYCVCWNGSRWIAGGLGTHTLAYSYDGLRWTGLGATVFSIQTNGIAWNGSLWVAVGSGLHTVAYSYDGLAWLGSVQGTAIFTSCNAVAWNGKQWVAVGLGTNSIAYSADGITWTAISSTIFSNKGNSVAWTGSLWVAVGSGTNSIAYSSDGITWTPSPTGNAIFTDSANSVAWNGTRWVTVGAGGSHTIAYSTNGTTWIGFGKTLFSTAGNGVCWTSKRFIAVGQGTNTIIYSKDGITWYTAPNNIFTQGNGVAGNHRIGAIVCDSQVALSDSLDVLSDTYYNTGYTNFSATIQSRTYVTDKSNVVSIIKTLPGTPTNISSALYPIGYPIGARVSFTYPINTGGGVDAYYASAIDVSGVQPTVTVSSPSQPITITGLVTGTTYRFQVYSSNSVGQSSSTVSASTLLFQIPPSAPQNYSVVSNSLTNPTGIVVSFTAPSNLGGGIIINYTVTPYQGGIPVLSAQTGTGLSYTFTGLTPGGVYTFSAVGNNAAGAGADVSSSITYYTNPDPPTVGAITLQPPTSPTGVNVAFTAPTNTGGGSVLMYIAHAYYTTQFGNTLLISISAPSSSSPLYLTNLTQGTFYTYRVFAYNNTIYPRLESVESAPSAPTLY
jgi:hypothetical protein